MFFTVAGLALAAPNPNPQLWLLMEAAGGGLLIGATIVVGRIIGAPSPADAAH
jgi:Na+-driven multidrug efflux pump